MKLGVILLSVALCGSAASAKGRMTAEEAIADAETALDNGRVGDAADEGEKLQRTHGLPKALQDRVELIVARCKLMIGDFAKSEPLFAKLHKVQPEDSRISEWYARSLEGTGKTDAAFELLSNLGAHDALVDGDSYWSLAKIERSKGKTQDALKHAELALQKPIVLQSDELDREIHKFIGELSKKK